MNRSLGQIMITENLLTPEQVEEAVTFKNENRCHFGAACVELGFLTDRQVMEVLGIQLYMPVIRMSNFNIDSEALEFIPKDRARRLKVIPLFVIEDTLTVATAEPLNITAVDEIRKMTNKRIQMVLAKEKNIDRTEIGTILEELFKSLIERQFGQSDNCDVIVNIQGDEPVLDPELIDILVNEFSDTNIELATVAGMKLDAKNLNDINTVKVLLDRDGFAVNFRREPVETEAGGYYLSLIHI